jgi:hypothetical protein
MGFDSMFYEKCKERITNYMDFTITANNSYMLIMMIRDLQMNKNDIINISPAFYHMVSRNSMQALFVDISKMFDNDSQNMSIVWLLNSIKNNLDLLDNRVVNVSEYQHFNDNVYVNFSFNSLSELLNHYDDSIEKSEHDIKSLTILRNKFYGHLDKSAQNHLDSLFKDNSVSLLTIEKLLILNFNICNALHMYFNGGTFAPLDFNHNDLYKTISYIEKYKELSKNYNNYT